MYYLFNKVNTKIGINYFPPSFFICGLFFLHFVFTGFFTPYQLFGEPSALIAIMHHFMQFVYCPVGKSLTFRQKIKLTFGYNIIFLDIFS